MNLYTNLNCTEPKEIHILAMIRSVINETLVRWSMNECQNIEYDLKRNIRRK